MRSVFIITALLLCLNATAQPTGTAELFRNYASVFTTTRNTLVLGFIGTDYQRIRIKFISVIRDSENPSQYLVYGKSMVKNNVCEFQGAISIQTIEFVAGETPGLRQGTLKGNYVFYENPAQNHVGIFKGTFVSHFYISKDGKVMYDDLDSDADGFANNQFTGNWVSYSGKGQRPCNWGDYRIPQSGPLDVGTGEFIPAEKFNEHGWLNYRLANLGPRTSAAGEALRKENAEWWNQDAQLKGD